MSTFAVALRRSPVALVARLSGAFGSHVERTERCFRPSCFTDPTGTLGNVQNVDEGGKWVDMPSG